MFTSTRAAFLCILLLCLPAFALSSQADIPSLTETYLHPDGEFAFDYDPDWDIELNDDDSVDVVSDEFS